MCHQLCRPHVVAWQGVSIHFFLKDKIQNTNSKIQNQIQKYKIKYRNTKTIMQTTCCRLAGGISSLFSQWKYRFLNGNTKTTCCHLGAGDVDSFFRYEDKQASLELKQQPWSDRQFVTFRFLLCRCLHYRASVDLGTWYTGCF